MINLSRLRQATGMAALAAGLALGGNARAEEKVNFQFNEGSGGKTTDSVNGLVGYFGTPLEPALDTVQLVELSPSGEAGDRSMLTVGNGFLMADDSASGVLDIREGPITMEAWVYIDSAATRKTAEGIMAYGGSYKLGIRQQMLVFTLYGIIDIEASLAGPVPTDRWVHVAAAWEPGVGVHFFVDGVEYFVVDVNTSARALQHNYLSLGSEGTGNNIIGMLDRMRIHNAVLTAAEIDSVAAAPKAPLASTVVSYNFNETELPASNEVDPPLPTMQATEVVPAILGPDWTTDTPTGQEGDYALAFVNDDLAVKDVVVVDTSAVPLALGANDTNYTLQVWVKLPSGPLEERRVIFRANTTVAPQVTLSLNSDRTLHHTVLGTADWTTNVEVPDDNDWHHIAVVMENFSQIHFYLDGVLRQTVTRTQTNPPNTSASDRLLIGKESDSRYFTGMLDRLIIHNHALTAEELDFPAVPGLPTFDTPEAHPADVIADEGTTVVFTATPTSPTAATYQWYFAAKENDPGTAIAGETGTTLTLDNVSEADEGFYYLEVTNAAGTINSFPAELALTSSFEFTATGFEAPTFTSGPIDGQNRWATDQNEVTARVLTAAEIAAYLEAEVIIAGEPVHSGEQALVIGGPLVASTTTRSVLGYEDDTSITVDLWVRALGAGIANRPTGNTFFTIENGSGRRAAAFRLGPGGSIDYGTDVSGVWQASGFFWDDATWNHFRFDLDYTTHTYDMFINDLQVNFEPIPFYHPDSDMFALFRIFRGANQAGMIVDDLSVMGEGGVDEPELQIAESGTDLVISWPATFTEFTLQATESLAPATWTTVPHETVGAENRAVIQPTGSARFFQLVQ